MRNILYIALLAWLGAACAGTTNKLKVNTTADSRVSLAYNKTYSVLQSADFQKISENDQAYVLDEIDTQMRARGYEKKEEGGDLSVVFSVYSDNFNGKQDPSLPTLKFRKGTLLIHIVDETLNRSVWMGYASGLFQKTRELDERGLRFATRRILDEYPALAYGYVPARAPQR
ncbi:DUF4136 domain-containing protein [Siphonobacter aquaeclarae]|uniref:DUF4136 domain-containing protein n=1 Tax=Siphonobacter aquaeclarae TaxID=563176 RepID=A0A1G9PQH5_9BACT|nr:DUF4136 domain-containing protein [Siphonobacter aquaeclarae]SDM01092.1 protein of unknown function [Siphonobacter aquaeclarae]